MQDAAADYLRAALNILQRDPHRAPSARAAELALHLAGPAADFGALLQDRRQAAGLTLNYLAERSRLSINTIRNLEAGRTRPAQDTLEQLLAVPELGLSVAAHLPPVTPQELRPNSYLTHRYDPAGMAQDLRAVVNGPGGTLEQSHLYLDSQSAADYLAVCEAYGSTRGSLFAELQAVAARVAGMGGAVDVVAIGSGDGRAEVCLARALAMRKKVARLHLLDISHTLITEALGHATAVLLPEGVDVKAVHGNFHQLERYHMLHAAQGKPWRLYTLLGATIANLSDELRFFRDLHSCAAPGDLLLIDYQLAHDPPEQDPTLRPGAIPKVFLDWHAGPILRNNPRVRSVTMSAQLGPGHLPGSYIIGSIATATMDSGDPRTYRVMDSARYNPSALSEVLAGAGWSTVYAKAYDARTAVLLLQRS